MLCTNCGGTTRPKGAVCTRCGFDLSHVIALMNEPEDAVEETGNETRTAAQVARRALTLAAVISCAYGASKPEVIDWLRREKLWDESTPNERKFLSKRTSAKTRIAFSWKIEALVPLLWAIGKIGKMPGLGRPCDVEALKSAVVWPLHPTRGYISSATLRKATEISKECEKVYEAHWKVRDARIARRPMPKGLDPEVVQERHYGFNWVTGYLKQTWDDVTTDT
jgi:Domain of unknown function (DUF4272)